MGCVTVTCRYTRLMMKKIESIDEYVATYLREHNLTQVDLARKAKVSKMVMTRLRNGQTPTEQNFEKLLRAMKPPKEDAKQLIDLHKKLEDATKMGKKIIGKEQRRLYAVKKIQKLYDVEVDVQFGLREPHRKDSADREVIQRPAGYIVFSPKLKDAPCFRWVFVPEFVQGEIRGVNPILEIWDKDKWRMQTSREELELVRHIHAKVRSPHGGGVYCAAYDAAMSYADIEKFNPPHLDKESSTYEIGVELYDQIFNVLRQSLTFFHTSSDSAKEQREQLAPQVSKTLDVWEQLKHEKFLKLRIAMSFVSYFHSRLSPFES